MKKYTSGVPYAVIAPLGVLLTLGCCLLARLLAANVYAPPYGATYMAAFQVLNHMPLHFYIGTAAALPLLVSGIVAGVTRKKSKVRWIVFAICSVVYVALFVGGLVLEIMFAPQAAMLYMNTSMELLAYYIELDYMGLIGMGVAAFVIFLFSHLCMLPRVHSAAKFVGFGIFAVLSLVLTWLLLPVVLFTLDMPAAVLLAPAVAALIAALPAGLVLLLMGLLMKPKKKAAHTARAAVPVTDDGAAYKTQPIAPQPVVSKPVVEQPVVPQPETPAPVVSRPAEVPAESLCEPGMIFYAKEMNWTQHNAATDWNGAEYKIFRNGTLIFQNHFGELHPSAGAAAYRCQLNREGCTVLSALMRGFLNCEAHNNNADSIGWRMVGFSAQGEAVHETTGYVYGVEGLEAVVQFLKNDYQQYRTTSPTSGPVQN